MYPLLRREARQAGEKGTSVLDLLFCAIMAIILFFDWIRTDQGLKFLLALLLVILEIRLGIKFYEYEYNNWEVLILTAFVLAVTFTTVRVLLFPNKDS